MLWLSNKLLSQSISTFKNSISPRIKPARNIIREELIGNFQVLFLHTIVL